MNPRIRDNLFFLIVVTLIFNNVPKNIAMHFLGGPIGGQLVFYPVFIGLFYTAYCQRKYKNVLVDFEKVKNYILVYLGITFLSLILGIYKYPRIILDVRPHAAHIRVP